MSTINSVGTEPDAALWLRHSVAMNDETFPPEVRRGALGLLTALTTFGHGGLCGFSSQNATARAAPATYKKQKIIIKTFKIPQKERGGGRCHEEERECMKSYQDTESENILKPSRIV